MCQEDFYKREAGFSAEKLVLKDTNVGHAKVLRSQSNLQVEEREALIKMMNVIEATLERKQTILHVIDEFHNILINCKNCALAHFEEEDFVSHYTWLQENLKSTERALEAAIVHQQIMYSKMYTGLTVLPPVASKRYEQKLPPSNERKKVHCMLSQCTDEFSSELTVRAFKEPLIQQKPGIGQGGTHARKLRENFLLNRISSAVEVLLTGDLVSEMSQENSKHITESIPEVMVQTLNLFSNSNMPNLPQEIMDTIYSRNAALADLIEGMGMLESELIMSTQQ